MSEAGGLREAVEALADEPWHWTEGRILHDRLRALLAAHPAPDADPTAGERGSIRERLSKALHDERVEKGTQHADCWACEVVSGIAVYAVIWDADHLARTQTIADMRAKIDALPAPCTRPDVLAMLDREFPSEADR